jgi:hypothetical protein
VKLSAFYNPVVRGLLLVTTMELTHQVHRGVRERLGDLVGLSWAPFVALISALRRARMFHPRGIVFTGRCDSIADPPLASIGARLDGRVLARCSQALWRRETRSVDVLGIALRFRRGEGAALGAVAGAQDQDLLFATIRSPLTMLLSPFTTDTRDFLGNQYRAVSPFDAGVEGRVMLRLVPLEPPPRGRGTRGDRLRAAVASGRARWSLQARRTLSLRWHPVAVVELEREASLDQEALRFDPFRDGAGLVPVGFVQSIRRTVYAASQWARLNRRGATGWR